MQLAILQAVLLLTEVEHQVLGEGCSLIAVAVVIYNIVQFNMLQMEFTVTILRLISLTVIFKTISTMEFTASIIQALR